MDIIDQLKFFGSLGVSHLNLGRRRQNGSGAAKTAVVDIVRAPTEEPDIPPASPSRSLFVEEAPAPPSAFAVRRSLAQIRGEIGDCQRCKLCSRRTHIVFGVGDPNADLMFVGEAPGADEDEQGIPFVGKAGQLLTRIIETMFDIPRERVYIANIIKCRPPGNRDPEPDEVAACEGFLFQQIETVQPKIVIALGRCAAQTMLRTTTSITRLRGTFVDYRGRLLLPTFHPSYLLRTPSKKREVFNDMKAVRARLEDMGSSYYRK